MPRPGVPLATATTTTAGSSYGSIIVKHSSGTETYYNPSVDTDISRGTALLSAISAAVSGDIITLSANTYNAGTSEIVLPTGVSLYGQGISTTTIASSADFNADKFIITPGTNSIIGHLKVVGLMESTIGGDNVQAAIGFTEYDTIPIPTNFLLTNVHAIGNVDGLYIWTASPYSFSARAIDCIFESKLDAVFLVDATSGSLLVMENCTLTALGSSTVAGCDAFRYYGGNGSVKFYDCRLFAENGKSHNRAIFIEEGLKSVELHNCVLKTIPGATNKTCYDIYNTGVSGSISINNCSYDIDKVYSPDSEITQYSSNISSPGGGVPYTGATSGLVLGVYSLTASSIIATSLTSGYLPTIGTSGLIQNSSGTGFVKTTAGLVSYDNSTYLTSESDTLATVTTRGASAGATIYAGVGNALTLAASSITSSTGKISFGTNNLSTSGYLSSDNFTKTNHYTGFPNRTDTVLVWNNATATMTVSGAAGQVWIDGVSYSFTTLSKSFTDATSAITGFYWFWITAPGGVLQLNYQQDSITDHFSKCLVSTIYWNTETNKAVLGDERHWMGRDKWMHEYLHETVGARYSGGLTGTFTNTSASITAGEFYDEDIEHHLSGNVPMQYPGLDITSFKILYHNGSSAWAWDVSGAPYKMTGTALNFNTGNTLSTATSNRFVNYFVFATSDVDHPISVVIGTGEYTSLALAQAAAVPSLAALPNIESKLLYKITYRSDGIPTYQGAIDYRTTSSLPTANYVATDHASLTKLAFSQSGHSWDAAVDFGANNLTTTGTLTAGIGTFTATGGISAKNFSSAEYTAGVVGASYAIDWNNGKEQYLAMNSGASGITLSNPVGNSHYTLILKQPLSGASATLTWPTSTIMWVNKITPTLTTANSGVDVAFLIYSTALGKYIGSVANNLGY